MGTARLSQARVSGTLESPKHPKHAATGRFLVAPKQADGIALGFGPIKRRTNTASRDARQDEIHPRCRFREQPAQECTLADDDASWEGGRRSEEDYPPVVADQNERRDHRWTWINTERSKPFDRSLNGTSPPCSFPAFSSAYLGGESFRNPTRWLRTSRPS